MPRASIVVNVGNPQPLTIRNLDDEVLSSRRNYREDFMTIVQQQSQYATKQKTDRARKTARLQILPPKSRPTATGGHEIKVISATRPGTATPDRKVAATRRQEPELVVGTCQPDPESVRALIREWLVPLLVKEFLAEQKPFPGTGTLQIQEDDLLSPLAEGSGESPREHANG
jgi:hypothetical protein